MKPFRFRYFLATFSFLLLTVFGLAADDGSDATTHFGETWTGQVTNSSSGLRILAEPDPTATRSSAIRVQNGADNAVVSFYPPEGSIGVWGESHDIGVAGTSAWIGVYGAGEGMGVHGKSYEGEAVRGDSEFGTGVIGYSSNRGTGVLGNATEGNGVDGSSENGYGVASFSTSNSALFAHTYNAAPTILIQQAGEGELLNAINAKEETVFSIDNAGNVYSRSNSYSSDRNTKENFQTVDSVALLESVATLNISRWNYKQEPSNVQHIGPMAQDLYAAFGLNGGDDTHINSVDIQGVTLAAVQGLYQLVQEQQIKIAELEAKLSGQE